MSFSSLIGAADVLNVGTEMAAIAAGWRASPAHELIIPADHPLSALQMVALLSVILGATPRKAEQPDLMVWEWLGDKQRVALIFFLSGTMQGQQKIAFTKHNPETFKVIRNAVKSWGKA